MEKCLVCAFMLCSVCLLLSARVSGSARSRAIGRISPHVEEPYDAAVCLDSFQVSENTIIRTEDSRKLGAKYLNETELPTKEDCMQWCCDTNECNVAVYEEKNKGSCYIFDCGPVGDFKCKFTNHGHYDTAVLVNRHSYDLGKWGTEAKHEEELNNLRAANVPLLSTNVPASTTTNKPTVVSTASSVAHALVTTLNSPLNTASISLITPQTERRCTRFQFECRNSSECIAIYNACDGIAQCSDASDEGEECPTANGKKPNSKLATTSGSHILTPIQINRQVPVELHMESGPPYYHNGHEQEAAIEPDRTQEQSPPLFPYRQEYSQQDQQQLQQELQQQHSHQEQQPQYYKPKPRLERPPVPIFNHKGNGLQLQNQNQYDDQGGNGYHHPTSAHSPYGDQYESNGPEEARDDTYNRMHPPAAPPQPNYSNQDYDSGARVHTPGHEGSMSQSYSHGQPQVNAKTANNPAHPPAAHAEDYYSDRNNYQTRTGYNYHGENNELKELKNRQPQTHDYPNSADGSADVPPLEIFRGRGRAHRINTKVDEVPVAENGGTNLSENQQPQSVPKGEVIPESNAAKSIDLPTTNVTKNGGSAVALEATLQPDGYQQVTPTTSEVKSKDDTHSHSQLHKVEVNLAEVAVHNVDQSSESSGAVLALTLGLSITGLLMVMVGCRLRVVRRHLRRGKSPYTHDADYLVNGMYL